MIIGISGKIGSGKDTAGQILQDVTGWEIRKFADALKDCVCRIIGCTREQLEDREFKERPLGEEWNLWRVSGYTGEEYIFNTQKEGIETFGGYYRPVLQNLTPRKILQLLDTEAGRQIIHPNIWVNATFAGFDKSKDNIIITDIRFPNELEAVKNRGGITIRLERGDGDTGDHPSETALDNANFDFVVDNNGTIKELGDKLNNILCNIKV